MTHPGTRVRGLLRRVCGPDTMARLVDPTVADLQAEYAEARGRSRIGLARWRLVRAYLALVSALLRHGAGVAVHTLRSADEAQRSALRRSAAAGVVATFGAVWAFFGLDLFEVGLVPADHAQFSRLVLSLVPSLLGLAIPTGFALGVLWGFRRASMARPSRSAVWVAALFLSLVSLGNEDWGTPAANQAFRVAFAGRWVAKGANELTLGELRLRMQPGWFEPSDEVMPQTRRGLAFVYHSRLARAVAPLVLALLAVAALGTRREDRLGVLSLAAAAVCAYGALAPHVAGTLASSVGPRVPPAVAAWTPNLAVVALSLGYVLVAGRRDVRRCSSAGLP